MSSFPRRSRSGDDAQIVPRRTIRSAGSQLPVASDATLVDVCTGTGKQKSLRDYLDREAILGTDARGGAMALLVTTEMAAWQRDRRAASR